MKYLGIGLDHHAAGYNAILNASLAASVASNALTITLKSLDGSTLTSENHAFASIRNNTVTTGSVNSYLISSPMTLVVPSTATLGVVSFIPFRLWIVIFDDAGTLRLGVFNSSSLSNLRIYPLFESGVASSSAISGSSVSAGTFYTGSAVSSKSYKVIGYMEWTSGLATAGSWASLPTTIQNYGPGVRLPGQIIQVAYSPTSTGFSTTSTSPQDTTISQAIIPSSACSLIEIKHHGQMEVDGINIPLYMRTYRDSTGIGAIIGFYIAQNITMTPSAHIVFDAPATQSSVTYKAKVWIGGAGTAHYPSAGLGNPPYGAISVTELMG